MARIVLGARANGDKGLFVSPPGLDAMTAADSALLLSATSKVSQLILMGRVTVFPATVPLGLSRSPLVFMVSEFNFASVIGHTLGPGPIRPSPPFAATGSSTCTINENGASMTLQSPSNLPATFQVYSQAFT
jgi:hypothetical protein